MYVLLIICYLIIEFVRYVRYLKIYRMLNDIGRYDSSAPTAARKYHSKDFDGSKDNYSLLLTDLENHPDLITDNLCDLYMGHTDPQNMNYDDACECLYDMTERDPTHIAQIKRVLKNYIKYQKKNKVSVLKSKNHIPRLELRRSDIKAWFKPLPLYLAITIYDALVFWYMRNLGLKSYSFRGMDIWTNGYDPKKGNPLVFFHASIGGITLQIAAIQKYMDSYNLVMPNIPGMNFYDSGKVPLSLYGVADRALAFMQTEYSSKFTYGDRSIDVMGHSLGNNFCCGIINRHPNIVNRFFCVEGQIFFHRSLKVYTEFEIDALNLPITEILSYPLLHRDLYAQFFIQRLVKADEAFLYEVSHNGPYIYMFHTETDKKFLINAQLKYADIKELPLIYHVFKSRSSKSHGSFILDKNFREYVYSQMVKIVD